MRVRRCAIVTIEPRERLAFDLALVVEGGTGLHSVVEWAASAPHVDEEIVLTLEEVALLGQLSPSRWSDFEELASVHSRDVLESLVHKRLLVVEAEKESVREQILRDTHWRPASAAMHYASRWRGIDTQLMEREFKEYAQSSVLAQLGPPPPPVRERVPAEQRTALPPAEPTPFDALLLKRVTCRNYDRSRELALADFSSVLFRTFGARAVVETAPGVRLLKKGVPSAGGLHPTEAYLLVQRVEGVAPGLYHYHPVDHALEPIRALSADEATELARRFVAAQAYFVDAHVMVIPASRFRRNFWKYRNHAKAYRALTLDVGYLSHTIYLSATELGLAAFITAAINEIDIEEAFGLDPLEEGPLAVCGFGIRAAERKEVEFDPLHAVWPD
ncbi:putative peptide maturation dehydrogenase [Dokdonella sp.]|uniref:putative peptide maturation dehydrogenase n=1 Tax=Dokdonella sp. TaxID=2291710 RepID=UPI001B13DFCC|nr:putative peptide maturation dehydrogenase [Dokdonella sp.]MBO9661651.1 putative peptide maturation dehydrogenase [Dokdonella sp.]